MNPAPARLEEALTDNRRLLEQVERLRSQVRALEGVGKVADGIAHDFSNLITVIAGYSDVMLKRLGPEHPLRAAVEGIREAAERGSSLIQQLLAAHRREGIPSTLVNLNEVVTALLSTLRRLVGDTIDVTTVLETALGLVRVDPRQLEQVLATVVISARDAMPGGGRVVIRTANVDLAEPGAHHLRLLQAGRYVLLAITDTGAAAAAAAGPGALDRSASTRGSGRGTGLGLSIAYDIVRRAGGDVRVQGGPGRPASFEVYLPRQDPPDSAATIPSEKPDGPGTILLVEDEREVRDLVRDVLELEGHAVLVAEDGDAALRLEATHAGRIDLLITDVVMPGISGLDLADKLTAARPGLRTLLVSGYSDRCADGSTRSGPGRAFLRKPFPIEALVETVRRLLGETPTRHG